MDIILVETLALVWLSSDPAAASWLSAGISFSGAYYKAL